MLDSVKLKALKKQIIKKDEEIAALKEKNDALEKENAELRVKTDAEMEKVNEAAEEAAEIIREFRDKLLETEKLHQKFLRLIGDAQAMNEDYRNQVEALVADARKAKEGD